MALYIERIFQDPTSGIWYADAHLDGERKRFSLKTRDKGIANERRLAYARQDANPRAHSIETLEDAAAPMLDRCTTDAHVGKGRGGVSAITRHACEDASIPLLAFFGPDAKLHTITEARVSEYVAARSMTACARKPGKMIHSLTIAHELSVLRLTLKCARKRGTWDGDLARLVPSNKPQYEPRETWLSEHEAEIMLAELEDPKRKRWAALATYAGLRRSEVERLDWTRIHLTSEPRGGEYGETYGEIRVHGTKTHRAKRPIPIVPQLAAILLEVPEKDRKGLVAGKWGNVIRGCTAALSRALDAEASVRGERRKPNTKRPVPKHVTPNDLRRTFASWLIQAGVSNRLVADLLGHTSTAMVDRVYARIFGTTAHHRAVSKIARPIEPAIVTPPPTPAAPVAPPAFANVKPETLAKVNALLTLIDGDAADLLRGLVENAAPGSARSLPDRGRKTARGGAGGTRAKVLNTRNPGN